MKVSLLLGIFLYSLANLFSGFYDLLKIKSLPIEIDLVLILSGILFVITFVFILKNLKYWFFMVLISLLIASTIALYNEKILGSGDPTHHIYRGIFSVIILGIAYYLYKQKIENKLTEQKTTA